MNRVIRPYTGETDLADARSVIVRVRKRETFDIKISNHLTYVENIT